MRVLFNDGGGEVRIVKTTVEKDGCCNFCSRGTLAKGGRGLIYPYDEVYFFTSDANSGLAATICRDCADELSLFIRDGGKVIC